MITEVGEAFGVLHLTHSDEGTAYGNAVGAHFCQHASHIAQLVRILQTSPLVGSVGQVLVVVVTFVVTSVKQVLEVVESHAIQLVALVLCMGAAYSNEEHEHDE